MSYIYRNNWLFLPSNDVVVLRSAIISLIKINYFTIYFFVRSLIKILFTSTENPSKLIWCSDYFDHDYAIINQLFDIHNNSKSIRYWWTLSILKASETEFLLFHLLVVSKLLVDNTILPQDWYWWMQNTCTRNTDGTWIGSGAIFHRITHTQKMLRNGHCRIKDFQ